MELELATIDQIFDELEKRCDNIVVVMRKQVDQEGWLHGYKYLHPQSEPNAIETLCFMLDHTKHKLLKEYEESNREPEPWEEL